MGYLEENKRVKLECIATAVLMLNKSVIVVGKMSNETEVPTAKQVVDYANELFEFVNKDSDGKKE